MSPGLMYALLAGLLAAGSTVCAKLALASHHLVLLCESLLSVVRNGPIDCDWLHLPLRLLCGTLLLACNAVMWFFFSKALRYCSSSASATIATTGSNFICSGLLGRLLFGETHNTLWWVGISHVLIGLLLLHRAVPPQLQQRDKEE